MEGEKNIVSHFLTVVYWDVHCSGLNLQTYSDLYKGYCLLCCVECKGRGSVWCEETNFFLSNLYPNTGSAGDCVWVHSVIQKAHSRFTQSKWSVFWWPEWTSDLSLLASGFFFFSVSGKYTFLLRSLGWTFVCLCMEKFVSCLVELPRNHFAMPRCSLNFVISSWS